MVIVQIITSEASILNIKICMKIVLTDIVLNSFLHPNTDVLTFRTKCAKIMQS